MAVVNIKGVEINFPYRPYECQVQYMEKVIQCLQEVIFTCINYFIDGFDGNQEHSFRAGFCDVRFSIIKLKL